MSSDEAQDLLPYVQKIARHCAKRLVYMAGFPLDEMEDVQQDLLLAYLQRMPHHDKSRGSTINFARLVIEHHASRLIAYRTAACRNFRRDVSRYTGNRHFNPGSREYLRARRIDLARNVKKLPPSLRSVALALGYSTPLETAKLLNISRRTLYRRIDQIGDAFRQSGVDCYSRSQVRPEKC